jgi:hypothetical protein
MNRIEVYENGERQNIEDIYVTKFKEYIDYVGFGLSIQDIEFDIVGKLKGDKEMLEMAFQHEKKQSID